ncbi:MAG: hypothetical protein ACFCU1_14730 [Sumerlaeia bacterium]
MTPPPKHPPEAKPISPRRKTSRSVSKQTNKKAPTEIPLHREADPLKAPWALSLEKRLNRAEGLLDCWLNSFEQQLEVAKPDASKVGELLNIFTLLKRILEIHDLQNKILKNESAPANDTTPESFVLDSALFGGGVQCVDEGESEE